MTITIQYVQYAKERDVSPSRSPIVMSYPTFEGSSQYGFGSSSMGTYIYDAFAEECLTRKNEHEGKRYTPSEEERRRFAPLITLEAYQTEILNLFDADHFDFDRFKQLLKKPYYYPYNDETQICIEPNDYRDGSREIRELFKSAICLSCPVLEALVRDKNAFIAVQRKAREKGLLDTLMSCFKDNINWGDTNFSGLDLRGATFVGSLEGARFYEDDEEVGIREAAILSHTDFHDADARLAKITSIQIHDGTIRKNLLKIPSYCSLESIKKLEQEIEKLDRYGQGLKEKGIVSKGEAAMELAAKFKNKLNSPSIKKDGPSFRREFLDLANDSKYEVFKTKRHHAARQILSTMAVILGTGVLPGLVGLGIYRVATGKAAFSTTTTQNLVGRIEKAAKHAGPVRS